MKSLITKLAAVIIAAATMLGIAGFGATTANAAGSTPANNGTITVSTSTSFVGELKLYQMFTATVKEQDTTATPPTDASVTYTLKDSWKSFFTSADTTTTPGTNFVEYTDATTKKTVTIGEQAVKYINSLTEAQRADFANLAKNWAVANNIAADKSSDNDNATGKTTYTFKDLANGYYIVAPADNQLGQDGKYQALLVNLTNAEKNVSISLKHEFPTVDKTVNDHHASENKIGDKLDYVLTSTVPDMHEYTLGYTFIFHDTLSKGLTLMPDATDATKTNLKDFAPVVKILDGTNAANDQTLVAGADKDYVAEAVRNADDTTTITITMNDDFRKKHQLDRNDVGKKITVTYSATLNEQAVIGKDGNTNAAQVEYSNDPSNTQTGKSIPSEVRSHTFGFTIDKYTGKLYNESSERLAGATFKVYADDGKGNAANALKFKVTDKGSETKKAVAQYAGDDKQNDNTGTYTDELVTPQYGRLQIGGLKEGTYWVEETKAPAGYNKLADKIKVTISATYDTKGGKVDGALTDPDTGKTYTGKLVSWQVEYPGENNKTVTIKGEPPVIPVENKNEGDHPTLPSTGGMGTVLFTVFGVLIVALGAAWYVKSNKRSTRHAA